MKTGIQFLAAILVSTGALLGGLSMRNPAPAFLMALGSWVLFIWAYRTRAKKAARRRQNEQQFLNYMRLQASNRRRA